ncbi:MAG: adenylate/guanylate cyclase domain-containing protein [Pseudomonadota bacterium]
MNAFNTHIPNPDKINYPDKWERLRLQGLLPEMTNLFRHVVFRFCTVAVTATLLTFGVFSSFPPATELEIRQEDRVRIAFSEASAEQNPRISLVVIDEATMATLPYRSPVDRGFLSEIVDILASSGARAIGIDVLLDQPTEPDKDTALAQAIHAFGGPSVIAWADTRAGMTAAQSAWLAQFIDASGATPGFANLQHDQDGVVRHHISALTGTTVQSFAGHLAGRVSPQDDMAEWRIDWRLAQANGAPVFQKTPAHVLPLMTANPQILETWFRDRIVLIGADLPQQDRHATPLSLTQGGMPTAGVQIHAHLIAQLLDETVVAEVPAPAVLGYLLLAAGLAALTAVLPIHFMLRLATLVMLAAAHLALLVMIFRELGVLLPIIPPVVVVSLSAGGAIGVDAVLAHRERRFVRQAFSQYLAPELVEELVRTPDKLKLGGERRFMTFLFTDIAGFTGMSERLEPEVLAHLLNAYLDGVSATVIRNKGVIDKYIGDAVVALFGVPHEDPAHAANALRCAAEIDAFAQAFRKQHAETALGVTRIGVHSGSAVVGNFGGAAHFDYTAIGDAMNTAARLEGANKAFGTRVSFSGACYDAARPYQSTPLSVQPVGDVLLKGKTEPLPVLALATDRDAAWLDAYTGAYEKLADDPTGASDSFASLGDDALVALHQDRLARGETGTVFELSEK